MYITGGGCEMNRVLWDPCTRNADTAGCSVRTIGIHEPWLFHACPRWRCPLLDICNLNTQQQKIFLQMEAAWFTRKSVAGTRPEPVPELVPDGETASSSALFQQVSSSACRFQIPVLSHRCLNGTSIAWAYPPCCPPTNHWWSFPSAEPHKLTPGSTQRRAAISWLLYHNIWLRREAC